MITQHRSPTAPLVFVGSLMLMLVAPWLGLATANRMSLLTAGAIGLVLAASPARRWLEARARRRRGPSAL